MSVENADVIDGMGIDREKGCVSLTISDHLSWLDLNTHSLLIESKISRYLDFVNSGQIAEVNSNARDRPIEFVLVCKYEPTNEAAAFLAEVRVALQHRGVGFSYELLPTKNKGSE